MNRIITTALLSLIITLSLCTAQAQAQPTSFTYQGSLSDNGGLADGIYDFEFGLFAAASGGASLGTSTASTVDVVGGIFSVQLDFGPAAFDGSDRYLEISTRFNGDPTYTTLAPRVPIDSVPYAIYAAKANVANFANAGPFEPIDNTPKSSSGFLENESFIIVDFELGGINQNQSQPSVYFPIEVTRDVGFPFMGTPQAGVYHDFSVEVVRRANFNDPSWRNALHTNAPTDLRITMDIQAPSTDQTLYDFKDNGFVANYRIGYDPDIGTTEILTLHYKFGPFEINLANVVERTSTGYTPAGHAGTAPSFGGQKAIPGDMTYQWGGGVIDYTNAGVLPNESNPFPGNFPNNGTDMAPVVLLHHSIVDFRNTMFNEFDSTQGNAISIVRLVDTGGSPLWESQSQGIISTWSLNKAEDGGLFEAFTIEFAPVNP